MNGRPLYGADRRSPVGFICGGRSSHADDARHVLRELLKEDRRRG